MAALTLRNETPAALASDGSSPVSDGHSASEPKEHPDNSTAVPMTAAFNLRNCTLLAPITMDANWMRILPDR